MFQALTLHYRLQKQSPDIPATFRRLASFDEISQELRTGYTGLFLSPLLAAGLPGHYVSRRFLDKLTRLPSITRHWAGAFVLKSCHKFGESCKLLVIRFGVRFQHFSVVLIMRRNSVDVIGLLCRPDLPLAHQSASPYVLKRALFPLGGPQTITIHRPDLRCRVEVLRDDRALATYTEEGFFSGDLRRSLFACRRSEREGGSAFHIFFSLVKTVGDG